MKTRTAHVSFHSGGLTETVSVTQEAPEILQISPCIESVNCSYIEQVFNLDIKTNMSFSVIIENSSSWISFAESKFSDYSRYTFHLSANNSNCDRTDKILLLDDNGICLKTIAVTQKWIGAGDSDPHFSEAVELIGVVFKLAGAPEYNTCKISSINESIDSYFAEMTNHPAVVLANTYRSNGVSYDAVTGYGINLVISDQGEISFNQNIAEGSCSSFNRWNTQQKVDMLTALNDFYRDSDFHNWYSSTVDAISKNSVSAFKKVADIDYTWFDKFYGPVEKLSHQIILSFLIGTHSNGLSFSTTDGTNILSPVMGNANENSSGIYYSSSIYQTIIHEFSHPYCNPLIDEYLPQMSDKIKKIYQSVEEKMKSQAYGSPCTMMYETLVRSSVVRYVLSHKGSEAAENRIAYDENRGFVLVRPIASLMDKIEQDPEKYPNLTSLMPEIVDLINHYE